MASEHKRNGRRTGAVVASIAVALVVCLPISIRTFKPRQLLGPDVRISNGMALNDVLALMKQHGVTVKEGQGAVDVPDAIDFHYYNVPTSKSTDIIEIFAKRLKGEDEMFVRALELYPWHEMKPHQWSGEKYLRFESLSLDDIVSFQDHGIEPKGGRPLSAP